MKNLIIYILLFFLVKSVIFPLLLRLFKLIFRPLKPYFDRFVQWIDKKLMPIRRKILIARESTIMSISFGKPGSGKTTFAAREARRYIKAGLPVWSNVPIKGAYMLNAKTDPGQYEIKGDPIGLVILDEAGVEFSNRNFSKNFTDAAVEFWRLHRHAGVSVSVYSQDWQDSDITFRRLSYKLYIIKRSLLPKFICRVPINVKFGIDDQKHEPATLYSLPFPLFTPFLTKRIFAPLYWSMFDSWEMPEYPKKEWQTW